MLARLYDANQVRDMMSGPESRLHGVGEVNLRAKGGLSDTRLKSVII
jgi:hypothetical protein